MEVDRHRFHGQEEGDVATCITGESLEGARHQLSAYLRGSGPCSEVLSDASSMASGC